MQDADLGTLERGLLDREIVEERLPGEGEGIGGREQEQELNPRCHVERR